MNDKVLTDQLIDHADRLWRAECDNAERAISRSDKMTTGLVALVGLGLFRIEWYRSSADVPTMMPTAALAVKILLIAAVLCFVISMAMLRGRWKKRTNIERTNIERTNNERIEPILQSMRLKLPTETLHKVDSSSSSEAVNLAVFTRTYSAAVNLQKRNIRKFRRIARATIPFGMGIASVVIAMLIYMWSGHTVPSSTENANARYKQDQGSGVEPSTEKAAGFPGGI